MQESSSCFKHLSLLSTFSSIFHCPIPRPQVRNVTYWSEMWLTSGQPSHLMSVRSFSVMQTMLSLARNLFTLTLKWDTSTFSPFWRKAFSCMAGIASQSHVIVCRKRKYWHQTCKKHTTLALLKFIIVTKIGYLFKFNV